MRLWLSVAIAAVIGAAAVGAWAVVDHKDLARGSRLYAEHCAACHGKNLEGQADWQRRQPNGRLPAPPHDASGHTWHHPDQQLLTITKEGMAAIVPGYESDMPAFRDILTEEEIAAIFAFIKSTWPEREREYQAGRTAAANQ